MFVVDTNVLLYAVNPDCREHEAARTAVDEYRRGGRIWFLTWGIAYEFLRVSTHRAVFPTPLSLASAQAWLAALLDGPTCRMLTESERHPHILAELAARHPRLAGNAVHDLHIVTLMLEHGVSEIRTADADFHQFPFLRVVNPT